MQYRMQMEIVHNRITMFLVAMTGPFVFRLQNLRIFHVQFPLSTITDYLDCLFQNVISIDSEWKSFL